jgi:hypothetical protein
MINIDMINTIKQRVEYSRDLDTEAIKAVLLIIEQVEADILDILDGAVEHANFHSEVSEVEFEDNELVIDWMSFRSGEGSKEDRVGDDFKPKRDPNLYAMDQFNNL